MSSPIRVLHVIGIMNRGGAESFIMNLYRAIDRNKVQFDFVEGSNQTAAYDQEIMEMGGRVYRCPRFNGKNIVSYRKWWNDFFKDHASEYVAVHGHIGSTAAIYLSIAKKYGLHTIAHSHGEYGRISIDQVLYRILSYPTRYIADDFFTCSREAGISRFGRNVAIRLIRNGIDTKVFRFDPAQRLTIRKQLDVGSETVYGHVGRFTAEKNHKKIIDIFSVIHHKDPDTKLILIGDGPLRKEIEEYVHTLRLDSSICFLGVRSDVSELMNGMDLMIFPSLHEGLPVTLIEAQSLGLPCLISNVIPLSVVMINNLVYFKDINDSDESWAEQAMLMAKQDRTDGSESVIKHGFDISNTANELEEYYCGIQNG